jgi:hypothetical protein
MGVKISTDSSTDLDEAILNKYVSLDGTKTQGEMNYAEITYNGASWEVVAASDSCDIETGDLAWSTDHLVITLAGYTNIPCAVMSPVSTTTTTALLPEVDPQSNTALHIYFFDDAHANVATEATTMHFTIIIIGV